MYLKWLGHACYLVELGGLRVVMDPYDEKVGYLSLDVTADCVTISHSHFDHNNVSAVKGSPLIIKSPEEVKIGSITCHGIPVFHDLNKGIQRGTNIIFLLEGEGIRIAHLGDLGHTLSSEILSQMGEIDILLIPVGGVFTVDADSAYEIVKSMNPRITIPMHYKTRFLKFDLDKVEMFTRHFTSDKIKYLDKPNLHLETGEIKKLSGEVWVLNL